MGGYCPQTPILTALVKSAILVESWWEFGRGIIPRGSTDEPFILGVRGGGTERGFAQLLPKLSPLIQH